MNVNTLPEYKAWKAMKARCYAPCNKNDGNYQSKNIKVCKSWLHNFWKFYFDMGKRPSRKHSLDRINNDKDYSKENCRWATQSMQCKNRGSFNRIFTYKGETLVLKDWARKLGIKYSTLYLRITRSKLSFENAIKDDPFNHLIEIDGKKKTIIQWCRYYKREKGAVYCRIHEGWDKVRAILTPTNNNKKYDKSKIISETKLIKGK